MSLSLIEQDVVSLRRVLRDLLYKSEADGCVVCDSGGYVLGQEGRGTEDPLLVSALGAGVFAASRELARILGEDEFSAVFHQGEKKSIFIRAVNREVLLVIIFSATAKVGLVRLYASPAAAALRVMFDAISARGESVEHPEKAFVLTTDAPLFGSPGGARAGGRA